MTYTGRWNCLIGKKWPSSCKKIFFFFVLRGERVSAEERLALGWKRNWVRCSGWILSSVHQIFLAPESLKSVSPFGHDDSRWLLSVLLFFCCCSCFVLFCFFVKEIIAFNLHSTIQLTSHKIALYSLLCLSEYPLCWKQYRQRWLDTFCTDCFSCTTRRPEC